MLFSTRLVPLLTAALACAATGSLCGCGAGGAGKQGTRAVSGRGEASSSYENLPPTHEQQLVERGAHLFVADGCSACHAIGATAGAEAAPSTGAKAGSGASAKAAPSTGAGPGAGPSFGRLAGGKVTLVGGKRVLVDERFLREALSNPRATAVAGYPLAPMLAAVKRLQLARHPGDVTALVAFIEQVGPEDG